MYIAVKAALNSEDIMLWSSDINIKQPNSPGFYAPHQDSTYAGLSPSSSVLTAWVALSNPVGEKEGCLSFYPGSHKLNQLPHRNAHNKDNLLVMGQYIDSDLIATLNKPQCIELKAGQATLHSFDCVHESSPNKSDKPRVGLALRYMTSNVVQTKPTREMATWICGEKSLHFDLEPKLTDNPSVDELNTGRIFQKEGLEREEKNYFERGRDAHKDSMARFVCNYYEPKT